MANFSVSQVRHLYVANAYNAAVSDSSAVGTLGAVKKIEDGLGDQIMFLYKGADTVLPSDFIQIKNIGYAKAIAAADMAIKMKKVKVVLDSSINGGVPISGQDYILGIQFRNFFSSGDGSQYYKDAAVHATSGMSAADFYTEMKKALDRAFARENGATNTSNPYLLFTADASGLTIEEKPQEWQLGTKKARRIMFDVLCQTVYTGGDDIIWGQVSEETPTTTVGNGQQIADLEWFSMGERGDQYRMVGWPNVIYTKYLVDPTKTYNVLELHYAFTDTGVNSYRTEKEITIVAEDVSVLNDIIAAINSAAGLSIATL
jgi:hypothetical protein